MNKPFMKTCEANLQHCGWDEFPELDDDEEDEDDGGLLSTRKEKHRMFTSLAPGDQHICPSTSGASVHWNMEFYSHKYDVIKGWDLQVTFCVFLHRVCVAGACEHASPLLSNLSHARNGHERLGLQVQGVQNGLAYTLQRILQTSENRKPSYWIRTYLGLGDLFEPLSVYQYKRIICKSVN